MSDNSGNFVIAVAVGTAMLVLFVLAFLLVGLFMLPGVFSASVVSVEPIPAPSLDLAEPTPIPEPTPIVLTHDAPANSTNYQWTTIVDNLDNPLYMTHAGDNRLFALEQTGNILIIENGEILSDPFLEIADLLPDGVFQGGYSEQGLLGLAFPPDYVQTGFFYVSYTDLNGHSILARHTVSADDPNLADPDSAVEVLKVEQPFPDHNGGDIAFGPDGYLYMGFGDGGNVNEPNTRSLDPALLLGKMIRIDVSTQPYTVPADNPFLNDAAYRPEIWAMGLRNPWRFSFDRATDDLYIGEVGQWNWEEIDFQPAGVGGQNYGWSAYEGNHVYLPDAPEPLSVTMPIYEYPHDEGCSVTGGYVYRGANLPELQGYYFFGDYCGGQIWASYRTESGGWFTTLFMDTEYTISSFAEDAAGELYLIDYKGGVYRLESKS